MTGLCVAIALVSPAAGWADDAPLALPDDPSTPPSEASTPTNDPADGGYLDPVDGDAGYLDGADKPEPDPQMSAAEPAAPTPSGVGITLGLGAQIPTGGDIRGIGNDREMNGSANLSFGILGTVGGFLQWEVFSLRAGFGGLDPTYFERLTGFDEMSSHHVWFGTHVRAEIVPMGPVRPFVSGFFGADRVAATASAGTGVYLCDEGVFGATRCREETHRELGIGYWGWSGGFGGGVRIPRLVKPIGLVIEGWAAHTHYGRFTSSEYRNVRLRDDARRVWSGGGHIAVQLLSP